MLDDIAVRGEVIEDSAGGLGSSAGIGARRWCVGRRRLTITRRAVASLLGDVCNQGCSSFRRRRRTVHASDTGQRVVAKQERVKRTERRERARLRQAEELFNEVNGSGEL